MFIIMYHFSGTFCALLEYGLGHHSGTTSTLGMEEKEENEEKQGNIFFLTSQQLSSVSKEKSQT